jgi:multidrug resistance efflux pump
MEQPIKGNNQPAGTSLPVIPTPAGTRWREFRVRYVPLLAFAITVVLIWRLWSTLPPSMGVRGIGEGAVSLITSPQDGFIQEISVAPHGWAEAGQPVATLSPFDPRSRMDVFQSQLQLSRLALEPSMADRNAIDYQQLRVDSLRLKQELAMAQANLERAEKALPRHETLLKERLISQDIYDLTLRDRDYYQAEVREKSKAIEDIDARLGELSSISTHLTNGVNPAVERILPRLEEQIASIQTNWNPIPLTAPISGEVVYYRQPGEFVRAGELIIGINSPKADRIIAYVKQPIQFEPEVGAPVEVVTRSSKPQRFTTQVAQVGARVEVITNAVAYLQPGAIVDTGLPLILPIPDDVRIRPGEIVEVLWKEGGARTLAQRILGQ